MSEVGRREPAPFFAAAVETTGELDYREALDCSAFASGPVGPRAAGLARRHTRNDSGRLVVTSAPRHAGLRPA